MADFKEWQAEIESISQLLSNKPEMLKQYSIWLESSEVGNKYRGKNILDMLQGVMNYLSNIDFIPGIEHRNLAAVLQNIQKKTGLDLGLCEYLGGDIQEVERQIQEPKPAYCKCSLSGALVEDLSCCMPPQRCHCSYRQKAKSESSS